MSQIIERSLALAIFSVTLWCVTTFPFAQIPLLIGAFSYVGLLLWRPQLWLLLLPSLLPILYLSPWSGRVYFTEFDALVSLTLAVSLWKGRYVVSFRSMHLGSRLLLFAFLAVYIAALLKGLFPLPIFDANSIANYYSKLNSLRAAKGLLLALFLYPAWVAERRLNLQVAQKLLVTGIFLGSFIVFLVVLWERNVFYTLIFWTNKYAPIQALLDFSTQYRVTAMFADMHTGGTSIDGYLLLVFPFAAMAFFSARSPVAITFGALVFFGILYASVTTFSRGVYLGIGVALLATAFLVMWHNRLISRPLVIAALVLAFSGLAATGFVAFRSGGTIALFYVVTAFLGAAAVAQFRNRLGTRYLLGGLGLFTMLLIILTTSTIAVRHYAFSAVPPMLLAVVCILPSAAAGFYVADRLLRFFPQRQIWVSLIATSVLVALLTPSLFGYRMESRFSSVMEDLLHRVEHWQTAIDIMDRDPATTLFGQGLGRFPETYYWQHQQAKDVGGFAFHQEQGNKFLRYMGAHDVRLGQRLSLKPNTDYVLSVDVRTEDKTTLLYLRACHRQLIHPSEWNPLCVQFKEPVKSTDGQWKHLQFLFNSGAVGAWKNIFRAPLVFTISNRREYGLNLVPQTILDIDNVSIRNVYEEEQITNGDFEAGIDRWFGYYDQNHLPWHIKNIWVHVYFEIGVIGLILFSLLVLHALAATAKAARDSEFAFAIFVSLAGFLAVGSFGTLIDSPRIAFLFYLLTLLGLGFGRRASTVSAQSHASRSTLQG